MYAQTGMRSCVTLQVERVVKSFAAKSAQIALDLRVAFDMTVQQSLQVELLKSRDYNGFVYILHSDMRSDLKLAPGFAFVTTFYFLTKF